ncbi:cell division protein FtsZ [Capnocytophaga haemolytica]|uniref:Cell division protein FtsZ n=1 Tax=Capnocytophaga haemolytica TaxID=45243 RepID=A0AAX2H0M7_9FLAO|nr:cell division protein FtsZ [Capnocytophaga haemolytica]AMD85833.1 cell division protein FtsZ [Capnocytophaga haemolytica]SFN80920.1 cell division protein FtsZ [Capnocytophaga haemolytica]SNV15668.1 Cell division protein FtsZ [Capnocytophaga haemolytica]
MSQDILFDLPKNNSNYIKVIGVGGGGCNAVNFMHNEGIKGVDYVVCNTDAQALENSPVANKIQLGITITEGLGAGANPEIGEKAALESLEDIRKALEGNTQMVFITAGMGGGTGTGAVPVIAKQAKEMGILTVAIVTSPFMYEGLKRSRQAQAGIKKLRDSVDSLIVINNNKLTEIYGDLGIKESYAKADEILLKGAKGMAEVISKHYIMNIDLRDARTVLENGGTAIMGSAIADGENRAYDAVAAALNSPLLNDNKITGAKNALLLVVFGDKQATPRELEEISNFIQEQAGENMADLIMGVGEDDTLGDALSVTVVATGFDADQQQEIVNAETKKVIYTLDENQTVTHDLTERRGAVVNPLANTQENYPIPAVPEIKKEQSLSDLFNIWVDCEVISSEDETFVIVEKPQPKAAPHHNTERKQEVKASPMIKHQQHKEETYEAPIVHQLQEVGHNSMGGYRDRRESAPTINEKGEVRYTLEDYTELEQAFRDAKPNEYTSEKSSNEFILYKKEDSNHTLNTPVQMRMFDDEDDASLDPINGKISDVMTKRSSRLQDYNYKFGSGNQSRTSVGKDSSGEFQIRKNNSYLHDNVD